MTEASNSKANDRRGVIISVGVHAFILLLLYFLIAWRPPDPPIPQYGILINFGLSDQGSGDTQPETQPNTIDPVSEPEEAPTETAEETAETTEPVEDITEEAPAEEVVEEVTTTEDIDSPDVQPEEPQEETVPDKAEEPQPKPEQEKLKENTDDKKSTPSEGDSQEESKTPSQGDDKDKEGDKGDDQGSIDSRALYGNQGGGQGAALDLAGWNWDFEPQPDDQSNEEGRIVFEIKVDDQGYVLSIRTVEKTVSNAVERVYRRAVEEVTFSPTSDNAIPAPTSTGRITFIIKSR